jgi:hypothetical protein
MRLPIGHLLIGAALAMAPSVASANVTIVQTLAPFFNAGADTPPFPTETIGTFSGLPNADILAATISGIFGTPDSQSSAGVDLLLDGTLLVGQCVEGDACNNGTGVVAWSFSLTPDEFALLEDGSATLIGDQTSLGQINLDTTTLSVTVIEPANFGLLSLSLGGLVGGLLRRPRHRD